MFVVRSIPRSRVRSLSGFVMTKIFWKYNPGAAMILNRSFTKSSRQRYKVYSDAIIKKPPSGGFNYLDNTFCLLSIFFHLHLISFYFISSSKVPCYNFKVSFLTRLQCSFSIINIKGCLGIRN